MTTTLASSITSSLASPVSRTTPERGTTTYAYNNDDTINVVTDARGATATFSYNKRHLVTGITYGGTGAAPTPNVTYTYDAAGHRTLMTEAQFGKVDYVYNDLWQHATASSTNMKQSYDGDGLRVKKVENGVTTYSKINQAI